MPLALRVFTSTWFRVGESTRFGERKQIELLREEIERGSMSKMLLQAKSFSNPIILKILSFLLKGFSYRV